MVLLTSANELVTYFNVSSAEISLQVNGTQVYTEASFENGILYVEFTFSGNGTYEGSITINGQQVHGSPFSFVATDGTSMQASFSTYRWAPITTNNTIPLTRAPNWPMTINNTGFAWSLVYGKSLIFLLFELTYSNRQCPSDYGLELALNTFSFSDMSWIQYPNINSMYGTFEYEYVGPLSNQMYAPFGNNNIVTIIWNPTTQSSYVNAYKISTQAFLTENEFYVNGYGGSIICTQQSIYVYTGYVLIQCNLFFQVLTILQRYSSKFVEDVPEYIMDSPLSYMSIASDTNLYGPEQFGHTLRCSGPVPAGQYPVLFVISSDTKQERLGLYDASTPEYLYEIQINLSTMLCIIIPFELPSPGPSTISMSISSPVVDVDDSRFTYIYTFGGIFPNSSYSNELWRLQILPSYAFTQLPVENAIPAAISTYVMWDTLNSRLLLMGGSSEAGSILDDTWVLYDYGVDVNNTVVVPLTNTTGLEVGTAVQFFLQLRYASGDNVTTSGDTVAASLIPISDFGSPTVCWTEDEGSGQYTFNCLATAVGNYTLSLQINGLDASLQDSSVLQFFTAPVSVEDTIVSGSGVTSYVNVGSQEFEITLQDRFGNVIPYETAEESDLQVEILYSESSMSEAQPYSFNQTLLNNGTTLVTYNATNFAQYTVNITVDGTQVPGSPFSVTVNQPLYIAADSPWGIVTIVLHALGLAVDSVIVAILVTRRVPACSFDAPVLLSTVSAHISQLLYIGSRTTQLCQAVSLVGSIGAASFLGLTIALSIWLKKYNVIQEYYALNKMRAHIPTTLSLLKVIVVVELIWIIPVIVLYTELVTPIFLVLDGTVYDTCGLSTQGNALASVMAGLIILAAIYSHTQRGPQSPIPAVRFAFWSVTHVAVIAGAIIAVTYALQFSFFFQYAITTILIFIAGLGAVLLNFYARFLTISKDKQNWDDIDFSEAIMNFRRATNATRDSKVVQLANTSAIWRLSTEKKWRDCKLIIFEDQVIVFDMRSGEGAAVNRTLMEAFGEINRKGKSTQSETIYVLSASYGDTSVQIGFSSADERNNWLRPLSCCQL